MFKIHLIVTICLIKLVSSEFSLNNVKLEALKPKGIRVSIPDQPGIEFFAFHGRLSKPLDIVEHGDFSAEIDKAKNNMWVYENLDVTLKPGDEVHYWIFAQYNRLGYRKDKQKWTVTELVSSEGTTCDQSETIANGKTVCKGAKILFDQFKTTISTSDWITEQYIPTFGPNYEFSMYRNNPENVFIQNEVLYLKPIPTPENIQMQSDRTLNLGDVCTSNNPGECSITRKAFIIIPPITSAKVRSRLTFKFGHVEIVAKLPRGDWIYPIVQLQSANNPNTSIWLAYSRGNDQLVGTNGEDIGSRILFGGPVLESFEPKRSEHLRSHNSGTSYNTDVHTYSCRWEYGRIVLSIDGTAYGTIDTRNLPDFNNGEFYLTLGVGVGGINDFPDGFNSNGIQKPWKNQDRKFVINFRDSKNQWLQTWNDNQCALQVDAVTITAI